MISNKNIKQENNYDTRQASFHYIMMIVSQIMMIPNKAYKKINIMKKKYFNLFKSFLKNQLLCRSLMLN